MDRAIHLPKNAQVKAFWKIKLGNSCIHQKKHQALYTEWRETVSNAPERTHWESQISISKNPYPNKTLGLVIYKWKSHFLSLYSVFLFLFFSFLRVPTAASKGVALPDEAFCGHWHRHLHRWAWCPGAQTAASEHISLVTLRELLASGSARVKVIVHVRLQSALPMIAAAATQGRSGATVCCEW